MSRPRVMITGAGGFIGGRIAEVLHCAGLASVIAGVRRWSSAARVGRLPIDIVLCDVTDREQVRDAVGDVSAVIHCAVGSRDVTVHGTRNVLEAALACRVQRLVHLSTTDVYGATVGEIREEAPLLYTGSQYGDSKIDAENLCWEFLERGLPISILRPTIVHGPFSPVWTIDIAERLVQTGRLPLAKQYCEGTCNLLYIDDLVAAIIQALRVDGAVGEAFNVNGAERPTWYEYFRALNEAMGFGEAKGQSSAASCLHAWLMKPVRSSAKFLLKHFQDRIMALYKSSDLARIAMRRAERMIRNSPTTAELQLYSKQASYPTEKAEKILGYKPQFNLDEAVKLSAVWLEHHGFLPGRRSHPAGGPRL